MAGRESTYFHPEPGLKMELNLHSPISFNGVHREIVGSVQSLLGKEVVMVVVNTRSLCITRHSLSSYSMLDRKVR